MINDIKKIATFIRKNSEHRPNQEFYLIPLNRYWMTLYERDGNHKIELYKDFRYISGVSYTDDGEIVAGESFLNAYKRCMNE